MVVCADQFFNETVQHADIVLPVTTAFEEWNVDASHWHYWLSINQPAIKPMYEAKCDLEIAVLLSRTINKLEPGSCTFPQEFNHKRWLDGEFNDGMAKMFGISSQDDLLDGPKKAILPSSAARYDRKFKTPQESLSSDLSCVRKMVIRRCRNTNRRRKARCHSTCLHRMCSSVSIPNLSTLTGCRSSIRSRLSICIRFPQKKRHCRKRLVKVFNTVGEVELRAKVTANVPEDFPGDVRGVVPETEIQRSKRGGRYPSRYGVDENRCAVRLSTVSLRTSF